MDNYFLDLHNKMGRKGKLLSSGLCNSVSSQYWDVFGLVCASYEERTEQEELGFDYTYWGSGLPRDHKNEEYGYTPLRQTIILFCHEILNNQ